MTAPLVWIFRSSKPGNNEGAFTCAATAAPSVVCRNSRRDVMAARDYTHAQGMEDVPGHELHGTRQVGHWPPDELVGLWGRAVSGVVKYGFVVEYRDLDPPRTGIFDGLRIV